MRNIKQRIVLIMVEKATSKWTVGILKEDRSALIVTSMGTFRLIAQKNEDHFLVCTQINNHILFGKLTLYK